MNRKVTLGMICTYAATSAVFILPRYEQQWDWRDYSAIALVVLLLWWFLAPLQRPSLEGPNAHEGTGDGFAFRLGKALNRVWRGLR